jgi:glucans biosynthesis protein
MRFEIVAQPKKHTKPENLSLTRRQWMQGSAGLIASTGLGMPFLATCAHAQNQSYFQQLLGELLGDGQKFVASHVLDLARQLAKKPYQGPTNPLPDLFATLDADTYAQIKAKPQSYLWDQEGRGFTIEPLHRGFAFQAPIALNVVEDGVIRRVTYEQNRFDFGKLAVPDNIPNLSFSGFRIFGDAQDGPMREVAVFQGATFYRSLARGQVTGATARSLVVKLGDQKGEEFPTFRAFWLEKPSPVSDTIIIHAILDSESVTGAYRFTIKSGEVTLIDTEMTLVPRITIENYGIAGMTSTYYFGPNSRRATDDVRVAAYKSGGLQIKNGNEEWIWRPLSNPQALQISQFVDPSPRGFGFLQRDRDFASFMDDDQSFEKRPSIWNEPIGEWSAGVVQLTEIPSDNDVNDNIVAFWRPKAPLQAGQEQSYVYRQYWCWLPPERPPLAAVGTTRTGRAGGRRRRFEVDFYDDSFKMPEEFSEMKPQISTNVGTITRVRKYFYPDRRLCRISFELDPGNETLAELRLLLLMGDKTISETWLYRWTA